MTTEDLIDLLKWNEQLGCYTRQGFEHLVWKKVADRAVWLIFFDIDDMKGLNNRGSWDETSALIKRSISVRSTDYVVGQILSGDEFAVVVTERTGQHADPLRLCQRIQNNFRENGTSATFAYGRIVSNELEINLKPLKQLVEHAKANNLRGTFNCIEEETPSAIKYQFMNRKISQPEAR